MVTWLNECLIMVFNGNQNTYHTPVPWVSQILLSVMKELHGDVIELEEGHCYEE